MQRSSQLPYSNLSSFGIISSSVIGSKLSIKFGQWRVLKLPTLSAKQEVDVYQNKILNYNLLYASPDAKSNSKDNACYKKGVLFL